MKTIFLRLFLFSTVMLLLSCFSKQQERYIVMDNAGILDSIQFSKLADLYLQHERKTTNQVALITTDSYFPDSTISDYAIRQFNKAGIGIKGINNGVLIVFCKPRRQVRITTGLGTEKVLTDSIANMIIQNVMIPQFKQEKYFEGLWDGSVAITSFLEKPENKIR